MLFGVTGSGGSTYTGGVFSLAVPGANNLNYTLTAAVQSGSATLGTITPGTGSLASGASQSCTVSATSTHLGVNTIAFTASDPNSSNLSQTTTATLTVLDHAAAAFVGGGGTLNLSFGTVEHGTQALQFQIENLPAAYRACLDLDSVMVLSDPLGIFSTDAMPFTDLAAGTTSTAAGKLTLASSLLLRGLAAIVEAYLIYWAMVYYVARRWFGFSREWAAPLASGISICGVAAAIATGGAIRASPQVPVLVSSLVVVFAVVEVLVLPWIAQTYLSHEPLVAAAWLGLAVKTDGAAVAAGGIAESLILAQNAAEGVKYQAGWILGVTATVKVFIDVFIGVWAFILAYIWTNYINPAPAERARVGEIWARFPKFILGFVATFAIGLALALTQAPPGLAKLTRRRRSQRLPRHLLPAHLLLDRRAFELPRLVAGRSGQACGGLSGRAVRLRHLGRADHFLVVLRRRETAAGV